ncbi:MAG TPA: hypothetical protein VGC53_02755 [Vicinamibacteria bacterium]|jgi:hypothetical protein
MNRSSTIRFVMTFAWSFALATLPSVAVAQESEQDVAALQNRVAELETALQSLRSEYGARLAALEQELATRAMPVVAEQTPEETSRDDDEERAALEAELAGILGEAPSGQSGGAASPPGQAGEQAFTLRARNLNQLNPEISVTGDTFLTRSDVSGDPERNQFRIAEFEAAFQAPLDPFSAAKAFVVFEEGEFELEESYIDWTTLPAGLGLKFGAYRHDFGKLNRWHQHALPQSNRPLVSQAFFGDDGLRGVGASLSWLPGPFLGDYNELWIQVTNDENDVSFSGRGFDTPVVTFHETNYWDLSPATYLEVGLSASTGVNDELGDFRTVVLGTDWNLSWSPAARALYSGLELRGEFLWQRRDGPEGTGESVGAYTYATYKLNRRLFAGLRGDWTELPEEPGESLWGVSPYVDWWQSEWVRIRVQYSYSSRMFEAPESENQLFFQATWSLGPHKHEQY